MHRLQNVDAARVAWRNSQELLSKIFDPDGYFDGGNIKPGTIETQMIAVGARSQQLDLQMRFETNVDADPNTVRHSEGQLIHYNAGAAIRTWQLPAATTTLDDDGAYYVYGRCNASNDYDAMIVFSPEPIRTDDEPGWFNFSLGVLQSVDADSQTRDLNLTYGFSTITGRTITSGVLQSRDKSTYLSLIHI